MQLRGPLWFLACSVLLSSAPALQAPLPAGWPARIELGMADSPGGAAAMRATAPFLFRYQYLAGGVNTGGGWATWNPNGDFAKFYIQDSVANGMIPVFTYYQLLQSLPGGGSESDADFAQPEQHRHDDGVLQRPQAVLPEGGRVHRPARRAARRAGLLGLHAAARRRATTPPRYRRRCRKPASPRCRAFRATSRASPRRWSSCATPTPRTSRSRIT